MKLQLVIKTALIIFFSSCFMAANAQDTPPTTQEAIDFIWKKELEIRQLSRDIISYSISWVESIQVTGSDNKMYISEYKIGGSSMYPYYVCDLTVINLSRVRIKDSCIYADNKEDIKTYSLMRKHLPDKYYKMSGLEKYDYFVKEKAEIRSPGIYPLNMPFGYVNYGRYKEDGSYVRVIKAFDFIIKSHGGGNIISDSNSKF